MMTDDRASWELYQPGLVGSTAPAIDKKVTEYRYELEPHILEVVPFQSMRGRVVELGCGIGTDGLLIAQTARPYIGIDYSPLALGVARGQHRHLGHSAFTRADLRSIPLKNGAADFIYSHGVIHHIRESEEVWGEVSRVLTRGGRFCVMVYHRHSINYFYGIMLLRRLLLLVASRLPSLCERFLKARGESCAVLESHLLKLKAGSFRYLFGGEWLSRNTDGPQNSYSRVFSRAELRAAMAAEGLVVDRFEVRYVNGRVNPPFGWLSHRQQRWLGRAAGWHLYAIGRKNGF